MSYKRCPACSALNREQDAYCFSCHGDLAALEAEQSAAPIEIATQTELERGSTLYQGLRAGAATGVFLGLMAALWVNMPGRREQAMLFTHDLGTVFLITLKYFLATLIFTTIIGAAVGKSNHLCWDREASVVGSFTGGVLGFVAWLFLYSPPVLTLFVLVLCVLCGAIAGAGAASFICYSERKYFRGMHVELKLDFTRGWWRYW